MHIHDSEHAQHGPTPINQTPSVLGDLPLLLVICGPTATGKSALAVEIAKRFTGEIISVDSRQVYRGLDVGSAKITQQEMQGIPHHLIDVVQPTDIFSVTDFKNHATHALEAIHARGALPILCGGTGHYLSALINDQPFPQVPPNPKLRERLTHYTASELAQELLILDPEAYARIDTHNPVRLVRAIEIATALGSVPPLETHHNYSSPIITIGKQSFRILIIGLTLPKEELMQRITSRITARIPALFDEIKQLHTGGVSWERLKSFGLEYRYGSEYVQGLTSEKQFIETLATKTWQFVRRQMTWFKRDARIHWMNPVSDHQKILDMIQEFSKR